MNDRPGYGDAEAKRIIERAAEIDAEHARQIDAPALREIAAEAGVSALAVERALQEHHSAPAERVPWFRRHPTLVTLGAITAALVLLALLRSVP